MSNVHGGLSRLRRRLGLDGSPMRRRSDRVQSWLKVAVGALLVGGLVVAGVVAHSSYRHGLAAVQRAGQTHQVSARVVSVVTWVSVEDGGHVPGTGRVVWSDAAGRHTQDVVTSAYPGESVRLFVDQDGRASTTRHSPTTTVLHAVVSGLSTAVIAVGGLFSVYLGAVLLIDRRRDALWGREWLAVEPGWRRQEL